ncbi:hypothetical protein ACETRX_36005, partial [Labrys portucalensis]
FSITSRNLTESQPTETAQLFSGWALIDGFAAFSNDSPDMNSRDFIYWYNDGMVEFLMEMDRQKVSLRNFHKQESDGQKRDGSYRDLPIRLSCLFARNECLLSLCTP